jgi:protein involved in polysaccharide export with SLBB domain
MMMKYRRGHSLRKRDRAGFVHTRFNVFCAIALLMIIAPVQAHRDDPRKTQPWDLIRVTVSGLAGQGKTELLRRVSKKGKLTLPYAAGDIDVTGKTTDEIATAVDEFYRNAEVTQDAKCQVEVVETADKAGVQPGPSLPGDVLEVRIWDLTAPNAESLMQCEVDADGNIVMPHIGKIKVVEMTDAQIEQAIIKAYTDAQLLARAPVAVRRLKAK